MIHLLRANEGGSSGDRAEAALSLDRALLIDPAYPGARRALFEAKRRQGDV
jgi:hypothetical protein